MHSLTKETDNVSFGAALVQLLIVAVIAFGFAFGADWGLGKALKAAGMEPKAAAAAPAAAPAPDEE